MLGSIDVHRRRRLVEHGVDKAPALQHFDLRWAVARDFFKDNVRVLAKARGSAPDTRRCSAHLGNESISGHFFVQRLILVFDPVATALVMLAVGQLLGVSRDTAGDFLGFEKRLGLLGCACAHPLADKVIQFLAQIGVQGLPGRPGLLMGILLHIDIHRLEGPLVHKRPEGTDIKVAVLGPIQIGGLKYGHAIAGTFLYPAQGEIIDESVIQALAHALDLGDINHLPLTRLLGVDIGHHHPIGAEDGADVIVDKRAAVSRGRWFGKSVDIHPAPLGLADGIIGGAIALFGHAAELGTPESAQMGDDQLGIHLEKHLIVKTELFHPHHIFHPHITIPDEGEKNLLEFRNPHIEFQGQTQFVSSLLDPGATDLFILGDVRIGQDKFSVAITITIGNHRRLAAIGIAHTGSLNVNHLCAVVCQHAGGKGGRHNATGHQDPHARQRTVGRNDRRCRNVLYCFPSFH
ncbi:hypothetical protein DESC_940019 [Desulfosarcina cetonica]|nr:hypothetical protein DESC_940019 [Desulfosarcina cetonica]